MSMCTPADVKAQVIEAFDEDGGLKDQMREVHSADLNKALLKFIAAIALTFIFSLITFVIFLNNIQNDVGQLQEFAKSGERFTQQDAEILRLRIQNNEAVLADVANKEQFDELKDVVIRLDERLREKGI